MAGEELRVQTRIHKNEESDLYWVVCAVNSRPIESPIHADSLNHAKVIEPQLRKLVQSVYRQAYRDGFRSCGAVIREAIGLD